MENTGQALQRMQTMPTLTATTLAGDSAFANQRNGLQKTMLNMVASTAGFDQPRACCVCFRRPDLLRHSGNLTARTLSINKTGAALTATGGTGQ